MYESKFKAFNNSRRRKDSIGLTATCIYRTSRSIIEQQAEQIQQLKDEIARLKNQPPRPKIEPSSLEKKKKGKSKRSKGKRAGSKKRHKTAQLTIHQDQPIEPENIPDGSEFRYYRNFCGSRSQTRSLTTSAIGSKYIKHLMAAMLPGKYRHI